MSLSAPVQAHLCTPGVLKRSQVSFTFHLFHLEKAAFFCSAMVGSAIVKKKSENESGINYTLYLYVWANEQITKNRKVPQTFINICP